MVQIVGAFHGEHIPPPVQTTRIQRTVVVVVVDDASLKICSKHERRGSTLIPLKSISMFLDVVFLSPYTQYERVLLSSFKMSRYNKKVDEVHHHYYFYYDSPGYPPALPPRGAPVKIPYPHLPAGP